MYSNADFEKLINYMEENGLISIKPLTIQIREFYKKTDLKMANYTQRYKDAVISILNQFPKKSLLE